MHQLSGRLSLDELPSHMQLNADKSKFVTVTGTMWQVEQLSRELATVKPDIAEELKNAHHVMDSFYTKNYLVIMRRIGVLEERLAEADRLQQEREAEAVRLQREERAKVQRLRRE